MYDVLVIGSGPAGIAAALTVQQKGCKTAVASVMGSIITSQTPPTDYYGLEGVTGEEIYLKGVRQAKHAGVDFFEQQITGLTQSGGVFTAAGQTVLQAQCVILATGKPNRHALPAFAAPFLHKGVHLRGEEAGFLYRNRMIGVLGADKYAVHQAMELTRTARAVTLFTNNGRIPSVPPAIGLNRYVIEKLEGKERLERILFENGTALNLDGLFIADRMADASDLCAGVGASFEELLPLVDKDGMTDVAGLFAAGDCTGKTHTLQEQTFDGYRVGCSVCRFLKK